MIGSGADGFRCVIGCSVVSGLALDQLSYPFAVSFDRKGNLFAMDLGNDRIQKFLLSDNSCGQ